MATDRNGKEFSVGDQVQGFAYNPMAGGANVIVTGEVILITDRAVIIKRTDGSELAISLAAAATCEIAIK